MSELDLVRLDPGLPPPERAHPDDAGLDLRTTVDVRIDPGERVLVGTGVAIALPPGHVGLVCARSGLAARHGIGLVNAPGVVDAGYRGEIRVCLVNHDRHAPVELHRGDRVAQLLVQRVELPTVRVVDALPGSTRGAGGFGSTGSGDNLRDPRPFTSREGHGQGIEYTAGSADGQIDA
ncbi:dUTP diphosphatase [Actinomycetospora soli]|uniref:dUTP diphosphatase n=1 Tax=Actinomycetospora soli TaxID=2893887 RepID=UPI001E2901A1|nr:dUTP diphosphatase [Actinomycetospora soli]MCD2189874.1 dUTP diphosphatase [Actinomycetospora soli]